MSASQPYTIVVALDYSEESDQALNKAFELCASEKVGVIHAVNVLPMVPPAMAETVPAVMGATAPLVDQAAARLKDHVETRAKTFNDAHPGRGLTAQGHRIVTHQRLSAPAEEVAQLAADVEADLVVVGTHGRRGVSRLVLGSVAEGVVRLAPCPVLVMRKKALPAPVPAIEPPCPRCVATRAETGGRETWCAQHRERHGQRHTYHQGDRVGADTNMPLVVRT
jgi:nucleotide-binding universal stress UspA family protein